MEERNPYQAPEAALGHAPRGRTPVRGLSVKAIALGFLAGFAAAIALSLASVVLLIAGGSPIDEIEENTVYLGWGLVNSLLSSAVSGYAAAVLAPTSELANAVAVGVVILALSALLYLPFDMGDLPLWYNIPAFLLTVPAAAVGGMARRRGHGAV